MAGGDFSKNLIKEYQYWAVYLHPNQGYLGRCIVSCKRKDALDLTDTTSKEQAELFLVLQELKEAVKKVFQPDWFNYAFLGNAARHLHAHFVPRYAKPRKFMGMVFEDKLYGHHYRTDHTFLTPEKVLVAIRDKLKEALNNISSSKDQIG